MEGEKGLLIDDLLSELFRRLNDFLTSKRGFGNPREKLSVIPNPRRSVSKINDIKIISILFSSLVASPISSGSHQRCCQHQKVPVKQEQYSRHQGSSSIATLSQICIYIITVFPNAVSAQGTGIKKRKIVLMTSITTHLPLKNLY